jgi:hypothetical protein
MHALDSATYSTFWERRTDHLMGEIRAWLDTAEARFLAYYAERERSRGVPARAPAARARLARAGRMT